MEVKHIVIVGGGTTGWWTAGYLAHAHPHLKITLVESADIPTISVGESVLPDVKNFFDKMNIDESKWMAECDSIYKLGNRFENWYEKGDSFNFTFWGNFDETVIKGTLYNRHRDETVYLKEKLSPRLSDYWLYLYNTNKKTSDDFHYELSDASEMMDCNCSPVDREGTNYLNRWSGYSYHFDASSAGKIVKDQVAIPLGVNHIVDTVKHAHVTSSGIDYIELENNGRLEGDLFIDCTGFARKLIKEFSTDIHYYDHILCDRAIVAPVKYNDIRVDMFPYTKSIAQDYGWQFIIPLRSRIGSGYVYSSNHLSDVGAEAAFRKLWKNYEFQSDLRMLKWVPGRLTSPWQKNVCCIGMSYGFIEPLEANALYMSQYCIQTLSILLKRKNYNILNNINKIYNKSCNIIMNQTADYILHRYGLTNRSDTKFWLDYKQLGEQENLAKSVVDRYIKCNNPKKYLWHDVLWVSTIIYMNIDASEIDLGKINPDLLPVVEAIFKFNKEVSRANSHSLPKIWELSNE